MGSGEYALDGKKGLLMEGAEAEVAVIDATDVIQRLQKQQKQQSKKKKRLQ
ncbi:hypothetical protein AGMMS49990_08620 [Endomicrobiia bacterium]|nr:hypothetical protein AGMMS49990_08620 [Endomicrobiia bacterium]